MTKEEKALQKFFKILSDTNRFKIFLHLAKSEECVCNIAKKLGLEQTLISHHLQTLREVGIILDRKVGTWVYCSLNKKKIEEIEKLQQKIINSKNIADKTCVSHDLCRQLTKQYEK